jgi:hypothetical protein
MDGKCLQQLYLGKRTFDQFVGLGIVLLYLTPLLAIFQLYNGGQFYWWLKPEFPEKTVDLQHRTDTLYQIMLYQVNIAITVVGDRH